MVIRWSVVSWCVEPSQPHRIISVLCWSVLSALPAWDFKSALQCTLQTYNHYNNNKRLFMVPQVLRAQSAYKDFRIPSFCHTHRHPPTNTPPPLPQPHTHNTYTNYPTYSHTHTNYPTSTHTHSHTTHTHHPQHTQNPPHTHTPQTQHPPTTPPPHKHNTHTPSLRLGSNP